MEQPEQETQVKAETNESSREEWAKELRIKFSKKDMIDKEGFLRTKYLYWFCVILTTILISNSHVWVTFEDQNRFWSPFYSVGSVLNYFHVLLPPEAESVDAGRWIFSD